MSILFDSPPKKQDTNSLKRQYFEQFSSWDAAEDFADGAKAWLISCGVKPLNVKLDDELSCIISVSWQDYIDLSNQMVDDSIYVIVDHDTHAIDDVEIYIWHIGEVAAAYLKEGQ